MNIHDKTDTLLPRGARDAGGAEEPGLVLLYAPLLSGLRSAIPLPPEGLVLGRDPPPGGMSLPFKSVSRVHARVWREGPALYVEDMGSRNGTLLHGKPVRKSVVQHGDEIDVGEVLFKVVSRSASRYAEYPLEGFVPPPPFENLRGGLVMDRIRREIEKTAPSPISLLILGETGTGKEVVASAIHRASGRPGRFSAVNCAAIPSTLLESELFGYRRGAFTGANEDRMGIVRSAERGTLFLDEIGDMPLEAQAKVLRLIETREVTPLGSHKPEPVDVRIVCATHRPLAMMVQEQKFRADLYARIAAHVIQLPPLRERKEDLFQLTQYILAAIGGPPRTIAPSFMIGLCAHAWPFNVRELDAALRRAMTLADATLDESHLPFVRGAGGQPLPAASGETAPPARSAGPPTEEELRVLLARHDGNVAAIARELGKDRKQIHRWLKHHNIHPDGFRS